MRLDGKDPFVADFPKRKYIRIVDYDYSTPGAYFITVCTANREKIFWADCRGELCSPANNIQTDYIHMILSINTNED